MAQYNKSVYGISLYGYENTFGGQYTSPEIAISADYSLSGRFNIGATWYLPEATYSFNSPEFVYSGSYTKGSQYVTLTNSGTPGVAKISFYGDKYSLVFRKTTGAGIIKVTNKLYIGGVLQSTVPTVINTNGAESIVTQAFNELWGLHEITIEHDSTSAADSAIYIYKIVARTTTVLMDIRYKTTTWGAWASVNDDANTTITAGTAGTFKYSAKSYKAEISGNTAYQFRFTLLSSDTKTCPGVLSTSFYVDGAAGTYADAGTLEVLVDLKETPTSIDTIDFIGTEGALVQSSITTVSPIVESGGSPDVAKSLASKNWSSFSCPYKTQSEQIATLNVKNVTIPNGYLEAATIVTPTISLTSHSSQSFKKYLSLLSTTYRPDTYTKIWYTILDATKWDGDIGDDGVLKITNIPMGYSEAPISLTSYLDNIDTIKKIRLKIDLRIDLTGVTTSGSYGYRFNSTPSVMSFGASGNVSYEETFSIGTEDAPSYGSAVYSDGTGAFPVTTNLSGSEEIYVTPYNLGYFTTPNFGITGLPVPVTYRIKLRNNSYNPKEFSLYWEGGSVAQTTNKNAKLMAFMRAVPDIQASPGFIPHFYKHYQYNKGTLIYPDTASDKISSTFKPALNDKNIPYQYNSYSYYLINGWEGIEDSNPAIDVNWHNPSTSISDALINISEDPVGDSIDISINSNYEIVSVPWVSAEMISDNTETVNRQNTTEEGPITVFLPASKIPEIPSYVDIDPTKNDLPIGEGVIASEILTPFEVGIINRSILEKGKIIPMQYDDNGTTKDVITATVQYTADSFVQVDAPAEGEAPIAMTRGMAYEPALDLLPNHHVVMIYAVKSIGNGEATWTEGTHYTLGSDNKHIDWSPSYDYDEFTNMLTVKASLASNPPPAFGQTYYVEYSYYKLDELAIVFRSQKYETVDLVENWVSPQFSNGSYTFVNDETYTKTLSAFDSGDFGELPEGIQNETLEYFVRDDSLYYDSTISGTKLKIGKSEQSPIELWIPEINSGTYSIQNKEFIKYSFPVTEDFHGLGISNKYTLQLYYNPSYPVTVVDADENIYTQVSFLTKDLSEYTPFNVERFRSYPDGVVVLGYDHINISTVRILDDQGNQITQDFSLFGRTLSFDIASIVNDTEYIEIEYAIENSFAVNYSDGVCELTFSNNVGDVSVTYESDPFYVGRSLVSPLKFNPLYNKMPYGFIYVTHNAGALSAFNVQVSPDWILRNGTDYAIITIECKDNYGNPVSNVCLSFRNILHGTITKITDAGLIIDGKAMFKYKPNKSIVDAQEQIAVIDSVSGLSQTFIINLKGNT